MLAKVLAARRNRVLWRRVKAGSQAFCWEGMDTKSMPAISRAFIAAPFRLSAVTLLRLDGQTAADASEGVAFHMPRLG